MNTELSAPIPVNGLDHVRVLVRDLEAAKDVFRDRLGFDVPPRGDNFGHPLGSYQTISRCGDAFYLEFLSIKDYAKARTGRAEMVRFLEQWQGGHSVVINVDSAEATAQALRARGLAASAPVAGSFLPEDQAGPLSSGWWLVNFEQAPFKREALSFIEYRRPWTDQTTYARQLPAQPNGVARGLAVWLAVRDLDLASSHLAAMGFARARRIALPMVGGVAQELRVAAGQHLLVVAAADARSAVARFIDDRGDAGVMGVSLAVSSHRPIVERMERWSGARVQPYDGAYGPSVLVSGEQACGLAIEFVG
jgi:catechol 2,3-dioxygenase-like lactoylglutathione lyase family enzyme